MLRFIHILCFLAYISLVLSAQDTTYPQRTAVDIAIKQTKMLVSELGVSSDTILCKKLYQMHLKYAQMRDISNTRSEALQRMLQMQEELKQLLTPEQFATFMNRQLNHAPRTPKSSYSRIITLQHHDTAPQTSSIDHTPLPLPVSRP
jgi:hypothetical protein